MRMQELFGTRLPIIQAPMAGVQGGELAIAVCNAGGKLLKVVEMKHKYGVAPNSPATQPDLVLSTGEVQ